MLQSKGMNKTTIAVIVSAILITVGTILAIFFARGYNFDLSKKEFFPTGILVATSDPDGATVWIDNKIKTATNNTINLAPGTYKVKIQKDGYTHWEKTVEIKKEEVFKTNVFLFPALSDLRPLTLTGAKNPEVSPDYTRIVYGVASGSAQLNLNPNGVWIIDMGRLFVSTTLLSSADFRQIYRNPVNDGLILSNASYLWSPDNKQILAFFGPLEKPTSAYLLDTDRLNDSPPEVSGTAPALLADWKKTTAQKLISQMGRLPVSIKDSLASSAADLVFSPDETKVLYTATASATMPIAITSYLPGKNPTAEIRTIKPKNQYVYDIKEDKNYLVPKSQWFPSSRHLISYANNTITVMEYDGTNPSIVFNGSFVPGKVFAWPNWSKLVILTSLGSPTGSENLYTVNFR